MGRVTLEEWIEQQRRVVKGVLTAREHRFLKLAAEGYSVREIAGIVEMSESTVRETLNLVVERLGARDRVHCIRLAYERGLLGEQQAAPEDPMFEKSGMVHRAAERYR